MHRWILGAALLALCAASGEGIAQPLAAQAPTAPAKPDRGPLPRVTCPPAGAAKALRLSVQSGPAWNGYFGVQFALRGRVPAGTTGWVALVESVPAGTEGSPVDRELVRTVAGPLPLNAPASGGPVTHLSAMRWPESAQPERLHARAWIEGAQGQVLAVADDRCGPDGRR